MEAVRGDENQPPETSGGSAPGRVGDALDLKCRGLSRKRCLAQHVGGNFRRVEKLKIGIGLRKPLLVGKAREGIFRRDFCHRDSAFGERLQVEAGIGGNARDLPANEDAQGEIVALRRFRAFDLAEADADGLRARAHDNRIGGIGAGLPGKIDQLACTGKKCRGIYF
ncbi:hypothetical protein AJ87_15605 [Rhizobium yanglingense]|nr:hypothetical protein AJ87_15605 [Rhizobium yanglingense]